MNKRKMIPAMAIAAAAAATLSLPVTASADAIGHRETTVMRADPMRDPPIRPVHDMERGYSHPYGHGPARWAPPRFRHDYGYPHGHGYRYDYGPVVRYEPRRDYPPVVRYEQRSDYRPIERYEPPRSNDIRMHISYDVHM